MSDVWAEAIAVEPVGDGVYATRLDDGWRVGGGLNGGYQMAVVGNALRAELPAKPDPIAFSTHFLSAAVAGPAQVHTRVLRDGGSIATVEARLVQDGQDRIVVLATCSDLDGLTDEVATTAVPAPITRREDCFPSSMASDEMRATAPLMDRFDMLFDPTHLGWALGEPSGEGIIQAWFRLKDGTPPDAISLLLAVDALPPVTFDLGRPGWAPTLELTAHVRARPAPGWLRVRHVTRNVAGGMFEEDCEVWDEADRLVAQSRQLARVPRRRS